MYALNNWAGVYIETLLLNTVGLCSNNVYNILRCVIMADFVARFKQNFMRVVKGAVRS